MDRNERFYKIEMMMRTLTLTRARARDQALTWMVIAC